MYKLSLKVHLYWFTKQILLTIALEITYFIIKL